MAETLSETIRQTPSHDAIVAGAGPAGVLTAVQLSRLGHDVLLLAAGRSRPRIEGLSQRVVDILQAQGLDRALRAVGPAVTREALWNREGGGRNREYVTNREVFDAALLQDCRAAGLETRNFSRLSVSEGEYGVLVAYAGRRASQSSRPARPHGQAFRHLLAPRSLENEIEADFRALRLDGMQAPSKGE